MRHGDRAGLAIAINVFVLLTNIKPTGRGIVESAVSRQMLNAESIDIVDVAKDINPKNLGVNLRSLLFRYGGAHRRDRGGIFRDQDSRPCNMLSDLLIGGNKFVYVQWPVARLEPAVSDEDVKSWRSTGVDYSDCRAQEKGLLISKYLQVESLDYDPRPLIQVKIVNGHRKGFFGVYSCPSGLINSTLSGVRRSDHFPPLEKRQVGVNYDSQECGYFNANFKKLAVILAGIGCFAVCYWGVWNLKLGPQDMWGLLALIAGTYGFVYCFSLLLKINMQDG